MSTELTAPIVAHQGGWDEILVFAVPIALAMVAVWLIERRARHKSEDTEKDDPAAPA